MAYTFQASGQSPDAVPPFYTFQIPKMPSFRISKAEGFDILTAKNKGSMILTTLLLKLLLTQSKSHKVSNTIK
jgi:hypothetical protein